MSDAKKKKKKDSFAVRMKKRGREFKNLGQTLANIVVTALRATASAVAYYRLRSVKESVDVAGIASVFD